MSSIRRTELGSGGVGGRLQPGRFRGAAAPLLAVALLCLACRTECKGGGDAAATLDCGTARADAGLDGTESNDGAGRGDGVDLPRVDVEGETQGGCGDGLCAGKPVEDCASCPQDCQCGEAQQCGPAGVCCKPASCGTLGHECGTTVDHCGGTLECGECEAGESCVAGACSPEVSQSNPHFPHVVAGASAEIVGVGRFGGETVALSRSHLAVAGPGEGGTLEWRSFVPVARWALALALDGGRAYVFSSGSHPASGYVSPAWICGYTLSQDSPPEKFGGAVFPSFPGEGLAGAPAKLAAGGGRVFAIAQGRGPVMVDMNGPAGPGVVSKGWNKAGALLDIALDGSVLYALDGLEGLVAFDAEATGSLDPLSTLQVAGFGSALAVEGGLALVAASGGGAYVVDVSDPSALKPGAFLECGTGSIVEVALAPPLAYAFTEPDHFLVAIDLADAQSPVCLGSVPLAEARQLWVAGDEVLAASGFSGVSVVKAGDSQALAIAQSLPLFGGKLHDGVLAGQTGFLAGSGGLSVWDLSVPTEPAWKDTYPLPGEGTEVAEHQGRVWTLSQEPGTASFLTSFDFSSPGAPGPVSLELPPGVSNLEAGEDALYFTIPDGKSGGWRLDQVPYDAGKDDLPGPYAALAEWPLSVRFQAPHLVVGWTKELGTLPQFGFHLVGKADGEGTGPYDGSVVGTFSVVGGAGRPPEMGLALSGDTAVLSVPIFSGDELAGLKAVGLSASGTPVLLSAHYRGNNPFVEATYGRIWSLRTDGMLSVMGLKDGQLESLLGSQIFLDLLDIPGGKFQVHGGYMFVFEDSLSIADGRAWILEEP